MIALNEKELNELEEILVADAKIAGIFYKGEEVKWLDAKTVKTNNISLTGGWNDYTRGGTIDKGTVNISKANYELTQEKASSFELDNLDEMENPVATIGNVFDTYSATISSPNTNHYCIEVLAEQAGQKVTETITAANALSAFDDAKQALEDAGTPEGNWVLLGSTSYIRLLQESEAISRTMEVATFNGQINREVQMLDGIPIMKIPTSQAVLPAPAGNKINFIMLWVPAANYIPKLSNVKAIPSSQIAGRFVDVLDILEYFDLIVYGGTVNAIYASTTL